MISELQNSRKQDYPLNQPDFWSGKHTPRTQHNSTRIDFAYCVHSTVPRNCFWEMCGEFGDLWGAAFPRAPGYLWVPTRIKIEEMKKNRKNLFEESY